MNTYAWMLEELEMIVAQEGQLSADDWAGVLMAIEEAKKENNMTLAQYRDKIVAEQDAKATRALKNLNEVYEERVSALQTALRHCVNALTEYERKPGGDMTPFMLGALDYARKALER